MFDGISVIVANYPISTQTLQRRQNNYRFFKSFLGILNKKIKNDFNNTNVLANRVSLTKFMLRHNIRLNVAAVNWLKNPRLWGPPVWKMLYELAENFSPSKKQLFYTFVSQLGSLLPCAKCGQNFNRLVDQTKTSWNTINSRNEMTRFIKSLHVQVNTLHRR